MELLSHIKNQSHLNSLANECQPYKGFISNFKQPQELSSPTLPARQGRTGIRDFLTWYQIVPFSSFCKRFKHCTDSITHLYTSFVLAHIRVVKRFLFPPFHCTRRPAFARYSFTLIELLVVIAILLPYWQRYYCLLFLKRGRRPGRLYV